jgi:hypothetical protein
MKANIAVLLTLLCITSAAFAAPLAATVAVRLKPDATAPAYTYLKAGADPAPAAGVIAPAGWAAVELPGPHDGYVRNQDLAKSMDMKPDAPIYTKPDPAAPVLTLATRDDQTDITGMTGKWVQIKLDRKLTGYYQLPEPASPAATALPAGTARAPSPTPAPMTDSTASPAAPIVTTGDDVANGLARQFTGTIVEAKRFLGPRPVYTYQLNDASGARLAYLDLGKLLLADRIESYLGRPVDVFGTAHTLPSSPTLVIAVETLNLR